MYENALGRFGDYQLFENPHFTKRIQFRIPRSKSRRIKKKWSKRPENWMEIPEPDVIIDKINRRMYCHPITGAKLRHALAEEEKRSVVRDTLYAYAGRPISGRTLLFNCMC